MSTKPFSAQRHFPSAGAIVEFYVADAKPKSVPNPEGFTVAGIDIEDKQAMNYVESEVRKGHGHGTVTVRVTWRREQSLEDENPVTEMTNVSWAVAA